MQKPGSPTCGQIACPALKVQAGVAHGAAFEHGAPVRLQVAPSAPGTHTLLQVPGLAGAGGTTPVQAPPAKGQTAAFAALKVQLAGPVVTEHVPGVPGFAGVTTTGRITDDGQSPFARASMSPLSHTKPARQQYKIARNLPVLLVRMVFPPGSGISRSPSFNEPLSTVTNHGGPVRDIFITLYSKKRARQQPDSLRRSSLLRGVARPLFRGMRFYF
ncbi:MAG TPA: hypothetical protein VEK34_16275 [Methylocella sp.]|nr:hypothetical protein [Methylocella sp.]